MLLAFNIDLAQENLKEVPVNQTLMHIKRVASRSEQTWGLTLKQRKTLKKWLVHVVLDTWDRVATRLGV